MTAEFILSELLSCANPIKAQHLQRFFKTGPGQYAEGDIFLGLEVPMTRNIVKFNKNTPLSELDILMASEYHEARLCALLIVVERFKKATSAERDELYKFYLAHARRINNWDLVDVTCSHIVGAHLLDKDRSVLYTLAGSDCLWEQRIAMVSTIAFIRNNEFDDTFALAECLITHPHDLIHKAIGWMLREVGKRNRQLLTDFLEVNATRLPRTSLRYAIEHYPQDDRKYFLGKK